MEFELFKTNWSVYRKVVDFDFMKHCQFGEQTKDYLKRISGRLRMLDLGCGDAIEMANQLKSMDIERYTGCDLSLHALDLAAANLSGVAGVTLVQDAMESLLERETNSYNVIHSGYAMHHLQDAEKVVVLDRVFQLLEPGGMFILIDVFRFPGQSRPDYISRYVRMLREDWVELTESDKNLIEDHIRQFDFPADQDFFLSITKDMGFNLIEIISPDEHHRMMLLQKPILG